MRSLLRQRGVVHDKDRIGSTDPFVRLDREFFLQRRFVPDAARNEMVQLVVVARRQSRRHRLHALSGAPPQSALPRRAAPPAVAPCARAAPRTAPATAPDPHSNPPRRLHKLRSRRSDEIISNPLICQSSANTKTR